MGADCDDRQTRTEAQEMMDVLMALGPVRIVDRELGTVAIEMPIPKVGLSPVLTRLLHVTARSNVVVPLEDRHRTASTAPGAPSGNPVDGAFR